MWALGLDSAMRCHGPFFPPSPMVFPDMAALRSTGGKKAKRVRSVRGTEEGGDWGQRPMEGGPREAGREAAARKPWMGLGEAWRGWEEPVA